MPRKPPITGKAAAMNAQKRIQRELAERNVNPTDRGIFGIEPVVVPPINDDLLNLAGFLIGPTNSPFQGGVFKLEVKVPDGYPFNPPKVKFTTRLWHPNICSQTGTICLDILNDQWAASLSLRTVMLSLQALLTSPEPDDPQDAVVAKQYKELPEMYAETARYWTYLFGIEAKTPEMASKFVQLEAKIEQITKMLRCERVNAMNALSCSNWDMAAAIRLLQ